MHASSFSLLLVRVFSSPNGAPRWKLTFPSHFHRVFLQRRRTSFSLASFLCSTDDAAGGGNSGNGKNL
uniref:Putative secreted protein n=1 Tax=Anopheles marajoara TaxID=58244 RepID=A0A2M4CGA6_9DIPT